MLYSGIVILNPHAGAVTKESKHRSFHTETQCAILPNPNTGHGGDEQIMREGRHLLLELPTQPGRKDGRKNSEGRKAGRRDRGGKVGEGRQRE